MPHFLQSHFSPVSYRTEFYSFVCRPLTKMHNLTNEKSLISLSLFLAAVQRMCSTDALISPSIVDEGKWRCLSFPYFILLTQVIPPFHHRVIFHITFPFPRPFHPSLFLFPFLLLPLLLLYLPLLFLFLIFLIPHSTSFFRSFNAPPPPPPVFK